MDPEIERLMQRTRQRRENLQQTLGKTPEALPRKRRTPLSDNLGNTPDDEPHPDDDSPKRRCSRERENLVKPDTPAVTGVKSRMAELAQERMNWSDTSDTAPKPAPRSSLGQVLDTPSDDAVMPRKLRLAALASAINTWEDDLSHPTIKKEEEKKPRWQPPSASTAPTPSSKATPAPLPPPSPSCMMLPKTPPRSTRPPSPLPDLRTPCQGEGAVLLLHVGRCCRGAGEEGGRVPPQDGCPPGCLFPQQGVLRPRPPRSPLDLIPVNAHGLNESEMEGETTEEEPTQRPVSDRMATWTQKTTPTPKGKVGGLAASWETQVKAATPRPSAPRPMQHTPLPARSTPIPQPAKQMCTPLGPKPTPQPSSQLATQPATPASTSSKDVDPALLPVSAKKSLWAERSAAPKKEAEPTAYSVLARMSAWENMTSANQVSNIKKVDPAAVTPTPAPPTPRPLSQTMSPSKSPAKAASKTPAPATPKMPLKESIAERAALISTPHPATPDPDKALSPARASSAMKSLQQRLLEQTSNSAKAQTAAERMREERMAELASIQNRWKDGVLKDQGQEGEEGEMQQAPATPRPGDHDAIKAQAQHAFEQSLAAMGFELDSEDSASFSFKKGQRSYNQQKKEEDHFGRQPQPQPCSALPAATATTATTAGVPPAPPVPQSSGSFKPPSSQPPRSGSLYKIVSQRKEGGVGVRQGRGPTIPQSTAQTTPRTTPQTTPQTLRKKVQFDDSFDSTEGSEVSETPSEATAEVESSSEDGGQAGPSHPGIMPEDSDSMEEKFVPAQHVFDDDDDSDDSLSAFVPAEVRRQSVLPSPRDKSRAKGRISDSDSEPEQRTVDHSRSTTDLLQYAREERRLEGRRVEVEGEEVRQPVHEYRVKVILRRKPDMGPSESDEDSEQADKAAIDDLLDEAMSDDDEEEVQLRHPQRHPVAAKRHNYVSAPPSSSEDRSLPYSIQSFRNSQNMERQVKTRIVRNSEYVAQDPVEEDIEMPDVPPTPRKTLQERIQELQELVHQEQNVIKQTSNALNQCCSSDSYFKGSQEQVECNRLLLLACQRRQAYLLEIERLKATGRLDPNAGGQQGSLTISDIRLPLKRDFVTKIGTPNDTSVYYFILLIRNGPQVICTQLLSTHDPMMRGSLDFPNLVKINGIAANFELPLEIYGMVVSREPVGKDKKKKTPKKSKTLRPRESPGGPKAVHASAFTLITSIILTRRCVDKTQFTLDRLPYLSPLHGTIFLRLKCLMETNVSERGFLTMFEDVSGLGAWHRRWVVLSGNKLCFWKYPDDEQRKEPMGYVDLKRCITEKVGLIPRDICARPNTFELVTVRQPRKGEEDTLVTKRFNTMTTIKHMLSADTKEERIVWCNKVNTALRNLRTWHPDALRPVSLPSTST